MRGDIDQGLINYRWARRLIDTFARAGVRHAFIAPGSRSTPLVLAAARHPDIDVRVHFDERGTAFMALGAARASGLPALWITTSGTAVANGMPAVVEASVDAVPMILLTADRPPELRQTGANQTIDQVKIFGDYARWFVDVPAPEAAVNSDFLRDTAIQAVQMSLGPTAGPVHLNCMFREPLAPADPSFADDAEDRDEDIALIPSGRAEYVGSELDRVAEYLSTARRGLVVAGRLLSDDDARATEALSKRLGWPLLPDVSSGLRLAPDGGTHVHFFDAVIAASLHPEHPPDVVLHIGERPTSKRLWHYLADSGAPLVLLRGDSRPLRIGQRDVSVPGRPGHLLERVPTAGPADPDWLDAWRDSSRMAAEWLAERLSADEVCEPAVAREVVATLGGDESLVVASSMPIRDVDMFADPPASRFPVFTNRGASGIDGTIATAIGVAESSGRPVTIFCGDLALLHDLNSLAAVRSTRSSIRIVVVNNDGGGIFSMLPIRYHERHFEPWFGTPHGLRFEQAAAMFGLRYDAPSTMSELRTALSKREEHRLIEVRTGRQENAALHRSLWAEMREALS